jgi:hypothetical protein
MLIWSVVFNGFNSHSNLLFVVCVVSQVIFFNNDNIVILQITSKKFPGVTNSDLATCSLGAIQVRI